MLQQIGTQVAEQLERQVTNEQLWLGRRVKIIDGTGLSMADTAANQFEWPQKFHEPVSAIAHPWPVVVRRMINGLDVLQILDRYKR